MVLVPYCRLHRTARSCLFVVFAVLFVFYFLLSQEDIEVERFPPQKLPYYECPTSSGRYPSKAGTQFLEGNNLTDSRILLLVESVSSKHGKLISSMLAAIKIPFKTETFAKNLPLLTTESKGRYSTIIIENYFKYLNMPKWNRQLLDKYCLDYNVTIISFLHSQPNPSYWRMKVKGSSLAMWQAQTVKQLRTERSPIHYIAKTGATRELESKDWILFEANDNFSPVVSALDNIERERVAVIHDTGKEDGISRILFGFNVTDWTIKLTFFDAVRYATKGAAGWNLTRFVQVDVDDVFVGSRGTRMTEGDAVELLDCQRRLRQYIDNFTFCLGFSGSYFHNGDDSEDRGDDKLIELSSNFVWFPHMWRHNHAHEHNETVLQTAMQQNKLFAQSMNLPVLYNYAIAPQHDGVYPIHEGLFRAWKTVWDVRVTATEEYPHFKPSAYRQGFVHRDISVLPRQTCGLYTHTQFFHNYPEGFEKLVELIQGGELFFSIVLNRISLFMTHQQNFAHDHLAVYTFENLVRFIKCWTNLELKWQNPMESAELYFQLFPQEKAPIWSNPCNDARHRAILPPSLNCANLTLPNVLIVGPQKTGSTALSSFLSLHPNVSVNHDIPHSFEELQFFGGKNYELGVDWYTSQFSAASVVHEKSATYFDNTNGARQAAALVPEAKIVVILYDPSKRAYSWYQHALAHNDSAALAAGSLEAVLTANDTATRSLRQRCVSGGRYTHHLDRWLEYYPMSQLILVDGEQLKTDPTTVLMELTKKLGLPYYNYSKVIRFSPSKGFFCKNAEGKVKCLGGSKGRHYEPMSSTLRAALNRLFFADNVALHKFLARNHLTVPSWLIDTLE